MHLYDEWRTLLDRGDARITLELIRTGQLNSGDLLKPGDKDLTAGSRTFPHERVLEMRRHVIAVLNLFEQVVVAGRDNVADARMIENYFSDAIASHLTRLAPFISAWEVEMGWSPAWTILEEAVEEWGDPDAGLPPL